MPNDNTPLHVCRDLVSTVYGGLLQYKNYEINIPADISVHYFAVGKMAAFDNENLVYLSYQFRNGAHYDIRFPVKKEGFILVIAKKHLQAAQEIGHKTDTI